MKKNNNLTTMTSTAILLLAISASKVAAFTYNHNQCEMAKPINYIDAECSDKTAFTMMIGKVGEIMLTASLIAVVGTAIFACAKESCQRTKALNKSTTRRYRLPLFDNSSKTSETSARTPLNHDLERGVAMYGAHGNTTFPVASAMTA